MRPEAAARASLCAVIRHDLEAMRKLELELAPLRAGLVSGKGSFRDGAAAGYVLHNLYNALENSFEQISRTFENHVTDPVRWHKELLDKMFLIIPGVRPAVLPESLRRTLNDLRGFRHLFRHSYDFEIDCVRLERLCDDWQRDQPLLYESLERFSQCLLQSADETEP